MKAQPPLSICPRICAHASSETTTEGIPIPPGGFPGRFQGGRYARRALPGVILSAPTAGHFFDNFNQSIKRHTDDTGRANGIPARMAQEPPRILQGILFPLSQAPLQAAAGGVQPKPREDSGAQTRQISRPEGRCRAASIASTAFGGRTMTLGHFVAYYFVFGFPAIMTVCWIRHLFRKDK